MCHQTPLLEVVLPGKKSFFYARVQPKDAKPILLRHFKTRGITRKISNAVSAAIDGILTDEKQQPVDRYSIDLRINRLPISWAGRNILPPNTADTLILPISTGIWPMTDSRPCKSAERIKAGRNNRPD